MEERLKRSNYRRANELKDSRYQGLTVSLDIRTLTQEMQSGMNWLEISSSPGVAEEGGAGMAPKLLP